MLHRIGNQRELGYLSGSLPQSLLGELFRRVARLDNAYGLDRNYMESGGYILLAEEPADMEKAKEIIDYDTHLCEWVEWIGNDWLAALYVINNDFTIELFMPKPIIPTTLLRELEGAST